MAAPEERRSANDRLRKWIAWLLHAGGILFVAVLVSFALQLLLESTGDSSGATAVRGVAYVALAGLGIALLLLITCLAYAVLRLLDDSSSD